MRFFAKLFSVVPKDEWDGIHLDLNQPHWELRGRTVFPQLLRALAALLQPGSMLYFEGGSPSRQLCVFFAQHAVPEPSHVAVGTIWPRPRVDHVPGTQQNLAELADLAESHAEPELAIHFHVYCEGKVLLEWHDAFTQPMLLSGEIPEERVRAFANAVSMTCALRQHKDRNGRDH